MREPPIIATATIISCRHEHLYDAALPNGKAVIAHVPKWLRAKVPHLEVGEKVKLELTPYDFNTARIAGRADS